MFTNELAEELVSFVATGVGPVSHPWPERRSGVVPVAPVVSAPERGFTSRLEPAKMSSQQFSFKGWMCLNVLIVRSQAQCT